MVTKKKSTGEKEAKKGRAKLNKLQLNKETVKDLSDSEEKQIKGGILTVVCAGPVYIQGVKGGGGATIACKTIDCLA